MIFEVGMGGELDSTNVIDYSDVAVFTAIGLDHTKELGDTIEKIAATKAGIIKKGSRVVVYKQADSVTAIIRKKCWEMDSVLYISEPDKVIFKKVTIDNQTFDYKNLEGLQIPLIGSY